MAIDDKQIELQQVVSEMRDLVANKDKELGENKEKMVKLETAFDKFETENQKLTLQIAEQQKKVLELTDKALAFERASNMMPRGDVEFKGKKSLYKGKFTEQEYREIFTEYMKRGVNQADFRHNREINEAFATLRTDVGPLGGYLVPEEFDSMIIKKITEISPIRQLARVRTTQSNRLSMPLRTGLVTSYFEGELQPVPASNSTYGKETIHLHRLSTMTTTSQEELFFAAVNMESEILQDMAESRAQKEGEKFVKGSGVGEPRGFMYNDLIATYYSGNATDIEWTTTIQMTGEIKVGYNPYYGFNRRTLSKLATMFSDDGVPIWTPGNVAAGVPNQILAYPYVLIPDMDDVAANAYPIVFGDFARGYTIVDSPNSLMIRDEYTGAPSAIVNVYNHYWTGGDVLLPETMIKLKVAENP